MTIYTAYIAGGVLAVILVFLIGTVVGKNITLSYYGIKKDITIDNLVMCFDCFSVIVVSSKLKWVDSDDGKSEFLCCPNCQHTTHYLLRNLEVSHIMKPKK